MVFTRFARTAASIGLTVFAQVAFAQDNYPNRPITLLHGFAAGGNSDTISRTIAEPLSQRLGQPVIVEARAGAGGNLASDRLVKSPPDGYTLITLTGGHAVGGAIYKSLPFDTVDDFQMISMLIYFPFVIAVKNDSRFHSLSELIAEAKAKPNTINYSSAGVGSPQHLAGALFCAMAGIEMIHIPYRGGTGPITDLLGGQVYILVDTQTVTLPHIASGAIRGLGVTSPEEWPSLKGIPPVGKTVAGYDVRSWMGVAAPKGLPAAITDRLNSEIRYVTARAPVKDKFEQLGNDVRASSPQEMHDWVKNEVAKWRKVVADAKIPQQ
ncbi:MAG: Bug family tripartite tricarboxylate transporter substrate binding protein [Xanthobacteraceae bacterium]